MSGVSLYEKDDGAAARTNNIEVRVGFKGPFQPGLESYQQYDYNRVCGTIPGPGVPSAVTTFTCDGNFIL